MGVMWGLVGGSGGVVRLAGLIFMYPGVAGNGGTDGGGWAGRFVRRFVLLFSLL